MTNNNSNNKQHTLLEILIANQINNGASLDEIMDIANQVENKKEREKIKTEITNILFRFLSDF